MSLDLMSRLGEAYGWSKSDLMAFSGGELMQILKRLLKNEKERGGQTVCPMLSMFGARKK